MPTEIPKKEQIKRQFLSRYLLCFNYPFVKHLKPLDFQVWCMMLVPRDLLLWSHSDEFQELSRRVYNTSSILEVWDLFIRWFYFPETL
jgi:hypothetical protein